MAYGSSQKDQQYNPLAESPTKSYLGKSMVINGKITSDEYLTVDGKITGNVSITKSISIGYNGQIEGEIKADEVKIEGKAIGDITANKTTVTSTGDFRGNLKSEKLVIENGAVFKGKINIDEK